MISININNKNDPISEKKKKKMNPPLLIKKKQPKRFETSKNGSWAVRMSIIHNKCCKTQILDEVPITIVYGLISQEQGKKKKLTHKALASSFLNTSLT